MSMRRFLIIKDMNTEELERRVNIFAQVHHIIDITIRCYKYNHLWYAFILYEEVQQS